MQSSQQNSGVPEKTDAERIEFEKSPNSTIFVLWKMNFKRGACSSSSFPTEAKVSINEMNPSGRIIVEFDIGTNNSIPDSRYLIQNCECSQEVAYR